MAAMSFSRRTAFLGDGTGTHRYGPGALGPKLPVDPCQTPSCSFPKPDVGGTRSEIAGAASAMRTVLPFAVMATNVCYRVGQLVN